MVIGDSTIFAIESEITRAYERLSFRALGFIVIHICGQSYGVRARDASMLACSYDAVGRRLANRGSHSTPFAGEDAANLADSILEALFGEAQEDKLFFGLPQEHFSELVHSRNVIWAPDGDEAFDDGSLVLQFDIGDSVRLIGFKRAEGPVHDPLTLTDLSMPADEFYNILEHWWRAFEVEWSAFPKTREV